MRHRSWIVLTLALCLAALVAGCAKKQAESTTSADTTAFSTNPTEQGQGNLTPQGQVPPPTTPPPSEAAPTPQPKPHKAPPAPRAEAPSAPAPNPGITVPSGTPLTVTLNNAISSQTAQVGDTWSGVVAENVNVGEKTVIPAGSTVSGTVTDVRPAKKGDRAMVDLAVDGMTVEGKDYRVHATTEAVVAGSTRARNLGAMAGGAAAGALIGRAVGGSGKGALIGGLLGGAAAGGAVAASKGYQVVLKDGTKITFNTSAPVAIKR